ncbi:MAG: hypothetical protein ACK4EY_14565 [Flavipsychrobacter sp.]
MSSERFRHINTINTIAAMAEQDVFAKTGMRVRFIVAPCIHSRDGEYPEDYLQVIANALGYNMSDYKREGRATGLVDLRRLATHFITAYFPDITDKKVAEIFHEGIDHTVIIHYNKTFQQKMSEPEFVEKYDAVLNAITQWQTLQELK